MFKCLIKCLFNIVFATIYFIMIAFISQQGKQEHFCLAAVNNSTKTVQQITQ